MSICFAPTGWCRIEEAPIVPFGELNSVLVAVVASESSDDEEDAKDNNSQSGDKVIADRDVERVFESSCMHNNDLLYDNNNNNIMSDKDKVLSEDLFNLYDIMNKRKDSGDDLKYLRGFTPSGINLEEVNKKVKGATSNEWLRNLMFIGNENTKFFHGILNSKRSQLAIRGTLVDGEWIVNLYWKLLVNDIVAAVKEFFALGLFSGIPIDISLNLSHMFFVDDAIFIGEYLGVDDNWLGVVSSQGLSLLSVDLSGFEVTDIGLCHVKDCKNVEDLNMNFVTRSRMFLLDTLVVFQT
uniref:F-box/LRR-repeat protein 14 n=1 Tax=Tanacetum cinerariifolium TaxID=118510 RepID=A0A6L2KX31_TANCI|nr:F-box/LRR-repeat protein 14 [Tanacetum cinerariifolium]